MKILVTGFTPFGGEQINPSWEAVRRLPDRIGEAELIKREIPIRVDKVQLFCSKCGKGVRVGFNVDGDKKVRVCKKCGKEI